MESQRKVCVLMIGTGEYTTGYVHGAASDSDKSAGVVALTMFDLRARGLVDRIGLCGVNGKKFPSIRNHLQKAIGDVYSGLDLTLDTFPADDVVDAEAYKRAIDSFHPGDCVTIFTPDDTHYDIALYAAQKGLHVLVTKPAVKTLEQHRQLNQAAQQHNALVAVEVHKRWDPMYTDARDKLMQLGAFSYLCAYMSQPKHQLHTFQSWAGVSSDISYYLNSHHIDFHEWVVGENSRPVLVVASASSGVASSEAHGHMQCEDTITLLVTWENLGSHAGSQGTAVYTSSWVAPRSDVHSQQRFFYMTHQGEVTIDQAHRGYTLATDSSGGLRSVNPLFMKYTPTDGKFSGQLGYGYRSFEAFVKAVAAINWGEKTVRDYDHSLASLATTFRTTAILEAGRRSLDFKRPVQILYEDSSQPTLPTLLI
ncbi:Gfo/Idh/MocA family oxidoreductase [archaeon]|nr:MAG: Gfo/Idh/MocA family oxidoreductase [archaeon]